MEGIYGKRYKSLNKANPQPSSPDRVLPDCSAEGGMRFTFPPYDCYGCFPAYPSFFGSRP
jgi:hypothetical protein